MVQETLAENPYHLNAEPTATQQPIRLTGTPEAPTITFTVGCEQSTMERVVQLYSFDHHPTAPGKQAAGLAGHDGCAVGLSEKYFLQTMKPEKGQSEADFRADQRVEALYFLIQELAHSVFEEGFEGSDCQQCLKSKGDTYEGGPSWESSLTAGCSEFYSKATTASFFCKEANKMSGEPPNQTPAYDQAQRDEFKSKADQAAKECEKYKNRCAAAKLGAATECPADCGGNGYKTPCDTPEGCPGDCELS